VESIILNRATKSLTLYFQMIGRGSRVIPGKKEFTVIDLGNNLSRFGLWEESIDWDYIFRHPEAYLESLRSDEEIERHYKYLMPDELREKFAKSENIDFDIKDEHYKALAEGHRPKIVIDRSIEQHLRMCKDNSETLDEAIALADLLKEEIDYRVRVYSRCLSKTSESYVKWLQDDYRRKLKAGLLRDSHHDDESFEVFPEMDEE
jgi:type I site-specific restriction endonuclease